MLLLLLLLLMLLMLLCQHMLGVGAGIDGCFVENGQPTGPGLSLLHRWTRNLSNRNTTGSCFVCLLRSGGIQAAIVLDIFQTDVRSITSI